MRIFMHYEKLPTQAIPKWPGLLLSVIANMVCYGATNCMMFQLEHLN